MTDRPALCQVLSWYLGHMICNFPTWRLWPEMGQLESKCCHRTQMSSQPMWKWELEWFPWKQAACSFACVALASDVRPASPSGQGCNLIKHFGAGSPSPPKHPPPPPNNTTQNNALASQTAVTAGKCSAAHPPRCLHQPHVAA